MRRQCDRHVGRAVRALLPGDERRSAVGRCTPRRYLSAEEFAGQSVVVVGGGTSRDRVPARTRGRGGALTWATRRPVEFRDESELTIEGGVAAVAAQDAAARAGAGAPVDRERDGRAAHPAYRRRHRARRAGRAPDVHARSRRTACAGPTARSPSADAIIWATGFRPELRHLAPLRLREKTGGLTVASGASWQDPRIFLAGYGPQASTIGANRAGRVIARQIMAQL